MDNLETLNPPHKKPPASLAAAFVAGVAVALSCVLVGFWMGRKPQPRTRAELNSTASAAKPPSAAPQPLASKEIADSSPAQADAHPNVAPDAKAQLPAVVRSNAAAATRPGVLVSQATAAPAPPGVVGAPSGSGFTIGMSPVPTRQKATELVSILKNLGYNAAMAPEGTRARSAFYRVEAGPYASRDDAELAMSKMRLEGLHPTDVVARNPAPAAPSVAPAKPPGEPVSTAPAPANSPTVTTPPARAASKPPAHRKTQPPLPSAVASGFAVQVEARKDSEGAERLVDRLKSLGYPAFLVTPGADGHDSLFRVQVGFYATPSDARTVRERLRSKGFRPFIKEPQKSESANAASPPQPSSATHP